VRVGSCLERRTKVRDQNHVERIQMHVGGKQTGKALVCVCVCLCHTISSTSSRGRRACLLARSLSVGVVVQTAGPCSRNENGSVEQHTKDTHADTRQGKNK